MATRAEREREKKASLLAAAEEVFTSKGYTDATLDEIIKLADTGKGTVYRYFGNKENLFYQLVLGKHQALMEDLWALARRESCGVPERMRLLSRRWLRFLTENKVLWPVVGNEMAGMNKGVVGDRQPDGTYRQYVRWGPMPSPEKLAEMQRYQEMINEEAEPLAAVYREGVEQGLFRRSAPSTRTLRTTCSSAWPWCSSSTPTRNGSSAAAARAARALRWTNWRTTSLRTFCSAWSIRRNGTPWKWPIIPRPPGRDAAARKNPRGFLRNRAGRRLPCPTKISPTKIPRWYHGPVPAGNLRIQEILFLLSFRETVLPMDWTPWTRTIRTMTVATMTSVWKRW